jgi:hypothetical protein
MSPQVETEEYNRKIYTYIGYTVTSQLIGFWRKVYLIHYDNKND